MHSQHLEYFCKVVECGSLSRAAIALGINQSALSRHIRNLEEELGVQLLYRNGRGVIMTDGGKRLLERATRALDEIALAKQEAAIARSGGLASLALGMTPTVARIMVKPLALQLINAFPNVQLRFLEGFSGHLTEWLDAGRLDLAVLYQGRGPGSVTPDKIFTERLSIVCSVDAPPLPAQMPSIRLSEFQLVLPSSPHGLRRLVEAVATSLRIRLDVRIEGDSFESILSLVKANLGATILPSAAIRDELKRGELQCAPLTEPEVTRTLVLATPTNRAPVTGLSTVTRLVRQELKRASEA